MDSSNRIIHEAKPRTDIPAGYNPALLLNSALLFSTWAAEINFPEGRTRKISGPLSEFAKPGRPRIHPRPEPRIKTNS
jgi:hypothetical protein